LAVHTNEVTRKGLANELALNCNSATDEIMNNCGLYDPQRYRNFGALRWSLRSVEMFAPWVRKVFIVTAGEVPSWIGEVKTLDIEMVSHKQIFPQDRWDTDLPTHNSLAIEANLHRIPGLAEHFIYFNNDMFLGRPLEKTFFFTEAGAAIMYSNADDVAPQKALVLSEIWGCSGWEKHQANGFRKSAIAEMQLFISIMWPASAACTSAMLARMSADRCSRSAAISGGILIELAGCLVDFCSQQEPNKICSMPRRGRSATLRGSGPCAVPREAG